MTETPIYEELVEGLLGMLARLEDRAEKLVTCAACGCLCRPSEVCPSCHPESVVPDAPR